MESRRLAKIKKCFRSGAYACLDNGDIISFKRKKPKKLTSKPHKSGYLYYSFFLDSEEIQIMGHQAVYIFYNMKCRKILKKEVNHKNFNKHDNRLYNLELLTAKENTQHYHNYKKSGYLLCDYY